MPKPIKLDSKNPFTISVSKHGMSIGKWMVDHITPKKSALEEELHHSKKQLKKFGKNWNLLKEAHLENSPGGTEVLIEFYKQAANYSEICWKIYNHKQKQQKGNQKKIAQEIKKAEKDFNYFWGEHIKYKNLKLKNKETPLEKQVDLAIEKVNQSRDELFETQKHYGEKSWHAKKALLTHLENISSFIQIDSANKRNLIERFPRQKDLLIPELNKLELRFKDTRKKISILKQSL